MCRNSPQNPLWNKKHPPIPKAENKKSPPWPPLKGGKKRGKGGQLDVSWRWMPCALSVPNIIILEKEKRINPAIELSGSDLESSKQIPSCAYQQAAADILHQKTPEETSVFFFSLEEASIAPSLTRVCTVWRIHLLLLCLAVKLWCTSRFHFVFGRNYFPRI